MINFFVFLFTLLFCCSTNTLTANTSGSEIYNNYCITCHSPQMSEMFQSPMVHDQKAWSNRKISAFSRAIDTNEILKNLIGEEKDKVILDSLLISAINGTDNGMPPRGTCMECTDDELKSAISFMMSEI